jgi:hypothetical protein
MSDSGKLNATGEAAAGETTFTPVPLLEEIKEHGRVWEDLANQYGVTNPDPPWKTSLDGMCDALGTTSCSPAMALEKKWLDGSIDREGVSSAVPLPLLERRWEEDELSETLYQDVPFPERQLLALTHSLIKRGLVTEEDLQRRMKEVHERLNAT